MGVLGLKINYRFYEMVVEVTERDAFPVFASADILKPKPSTPRSFRIAVQFNPSWSSLRLIVCGLVAFVCMGRNPKARDWGLECRVYSRGGLRAWGVD